MRRPHMRSRECGKRARHASPLRMRAVVGAGLKPAPTSTEVTTSCAASGGMRRQREVVALPRREGANDEAVEAGRKGCGIVRHLAVEDLCLLEQQRRQVRDLLRAGIGLGASHCLDDGVAHIELEYRLWPGAAVLAGKQTGELAIKAGTGNETRRTLGQTRRGAHIGYPLTERVLDRGDQRLVIDCARLGCTLLRRRGLLQQRDETEIDLALAQRLERLALVVLRHGGPQRIDGIGEEEEFDPPRQGPFKLW